MRSFDTTLNVVGAKKKFSTLGVVNLYARNDLRMEMPLHVSLPLVYFEKWRIDYVGEIHRHSSKGMTYIVVATEYHTKWAEAKAVKTDTAAHPATFMCENIISRFKVPKIVVSDMGTHFLNFLI